MSRLLEWIEEHVFVTPRRVREQTKNAFELGYDAGEARLRDRLHQD